MPHPIVREAHERALSMLSEGVARRDVLTYLAGAAERLARPGCAASILVIDKEGLLRNGASPNLPADYLDAIDRLKPHPKVGTCAAAAATGEVVVTRDFTADEKWTELRHLPLALGYVGAWSTPIKARDGKVVGTFGVYCREPYEPTPEDLHAMSVLASVAAETIARAG